MRMWADLQRLRRAITGLYREDGEDEQAAFELAKSARHFSRRTREQVDDKLSFSAVLMRAGEVNAANRLIEELEQDVRAEEAALFEQMNEVRIARTMRRDPPTRARLARVLVTATLGAAAMASSAVGTALTGMVREDDRVARVAPGLFAERGSRAGHDARVLGYTNEFGGRMKKVRIAQTEVLLSPAQLRMLEKITDGTAGNAALEQLLAQLQLPPDLAAEVRKVLSAASTVAAPTSPPPVEVPRPEAAAKKKAKKKAAQKQAEAAPDENPEPPQPEPQPEPSPSPGGEDKEDGKKSDGVDGGSSGSESESAGPQLPLP